MILLTDSAHFEFFLSVLTLGTSNTVRYAPQEENPNCTQVRKSFTISYMKNLEFNAN